MFHKYVIYVSITDLNRNDSTGMMWFMMDFDTFCNANHSTSILGSIVSMAKSLVGSPKL